MVKERLSTNIVWNNIAVIFIINMNCYIRDYNYTPFKTIELDSFPEYNKMESYNKI